jgi:plasmid stabilization system protein ParE
MIFEITKPPQAVRDIEECFVYIAKENLDTCVYFLAAIDDSITRICEVPLIGRKQNFSSNKFRMFRMWLVRGFEN